MKRNSKTISEQIEEFCSSIRREISHWKYLREHGCQDPFWSDGCNMNLTRNHILHYKSNIRKLCVENYIEFPMEYSIAVPPEVDMDYMAKNLEFPYRLKRQYTDMEKEAVRVCPVYVDELVESQLSFF